MITIYDKIVHSLIGSGTKDSFLLAYTLLNDSRELLAWYYFDTGDLEIPIRRGRDVKFNRLTTTMGLFRGTNMTSKTGKTILRKAKKTYEKKCKANSV